MILIYRECVNSCGEGVRIAVQRSEDIGFAMRVPIPCPPCNEQMKHAEEGGES